MRPARDLAAAALLLAAAAPAHATYSVVATDSATGEVGGAGTSCVGTLSVTIIHAAVPGVGAVHAQAQVNVNGRDRAAMLLEDGMTPDQIIADITSAGFDPNASARQYGVVDLSGRAAGFTGSTNGAEAGDVQGTTGTFTYSVQGNILTASSLAQAENGFLGGGCDLADRMMLALEAGAMNGEGDSRCTDDGIPSDSAFISIRTSDGGQHLLLDVTDSAPASPLVELRAQFDAWRVTHPCGAVADAGPGGPDGGGPDAGGATGDGGGCGCASSRSSSAGGLALALLAFALVTRPRRRGDGVQFAP
jgi:MYXO-CTERM domain-containing protein